MNGLNRFSGIVRRGVDDFGMISEDDAIAVGISGGKDSLVLLLALSYLRGYYPKKFRLEAITLDLGFGGMDYSPIEELCRRIDVPYTIIKTDIKEIVFDIRKEPNPCSLCSKMRRGGLNDAIRERNIKKLALGHHFDDAVETFFMSLFYEGRISCFKPVTYMSRADVWQIRPMIYASEQDIIQLAEKLALPIVKNPCPKDKESKRYEIKSMLQGLIAEYPDIKTKVFGAMRRLPLEGWEAENPKKIHPNNDD